MVSENELNQMVTINVNWIDVEDKLPDEQEYYWVTILNIFDGSLKTDGDWYYPDNGWDEYDENDDWIVVAWAKVNNPEPYKWSKTETNILDCNPADDIYDNSYLRGNNHE